MQRDAWYWRWARSNLPPGCLWRLWRSASTLTEPFRPDGNVFCWCRWGDITRLTYANYNKWKDDMILVLSAIRAYAIVTGDDPEPQRLDLNHDKNYDNWKAKAAEAVPMIRLSCSPEVQRIVKGMRNPQEMWNTLETSLDSAGSYIGRQDILRQFRACQPKEDKPLRAYFTKLYNYCTQLDHTGDAITDRDYRTHIFTSLPSQYAMILMVLKHRRPLPTPEEAMHDLLEGETTTGLTKELRDASRGAALLSPRGGYRGQRRGRSGYRGRGGRGGCGGSGGSGGSSGSGDSHESKCSYCKIDSHTTDACRKRKCTHEGGNNDECICYQCGLPGHVKVDCVSYKRIKEWWKMKKATAAAALAMTGDSDPFWLTACALAAAAAAAAMKWVIDSGASHHMCNDRSSFSMFKKLSLLIVIELRDNNSVAATHYGFVNIIQGYQVEALHAPTLWLSLLSINQLDLGGHMSIFQNGKCSITSKCSMTSPSSCTLARKLINGIYIIVSATTLLSSTTENGRKRHRVSSPPWESSPPRAPTAAKTKSTRKSLTISESRLPHWRLAHINLTAMKTLIGRYKHNDSMCTVRIQAEHKQRFIRVPVNRTKKPFEHVHSDVCGPFSTPTLGDNLYYILFIDDYMRYTSVWLLPNTQGETCTSAYQSFQARVDSVGYEIKRFRCDNGRGEYDNQTLRYDLAARSTTYEPCPPYAHHTNSVAEQMIRTITEKARAMMIDSQAPIQFWGEAVNPAVYLHQRSPNDGLEGNDRNGSQAPYETPYEMLNGFGKPTHNAAGNEISYQASLHNLRRFECYASRLIPKVQHRQGKFGPRS